MEANQILNREFLEIRAKIIEIAASLDRIDRASGDVSEDRRSVLLSQGISILASGDSDRAEQVQLLFSREYDPNWQQEFQASVR